MIIYMCTDNYCRHFLQIFDIISRQLNLVCIVEMGAFIILKIAGCKFALKNFSSRSHTFTWETNTFGLCSKLQRSPHCFFILPFITFIIRKCSSRFLPLFLQCLTLASKAQIVMANLPENCISCYSATIPLSRRKLA